MYVGVCGRVCSGRETERERKEEGEDGERGAFKRR